MRRAVTCLCLAVAACGDAAQDASSGPRRQPQALGAVLEAALVAAETAVQAETRPAALALPGPDSELRERMLGLVELLASSPPAGEMASIAREDAAAGPADGALVLGQLLAEEGRALRQRRAAAELLAVLARAFPAAADAACEALSLAQGNAQEPALRRTCADLIGDLGTSTGPGAATLREAARSQLPRLLLRLKYEEDNSAAAALARTLVELGNGAGLAMLLEMESSGRLPGTADSTDSQAHELERALDSVTAMWGYSSVAAADAAWTRGELGQQAPGPGLRLATWHTIAALRGERIQLRGVDDGRFVLARLGPWAARLLARALTDEDIYVRIHSAQCLGRMGQRGAPAREALLAALADPLLAPQAAEALGAIGGAGVGAALLASIGTGQEAELRAACVRALGELGEPTAVVPLRALFGTTESPALSVVIARALVELKSADPPVIDFLVRELVSDAGPLAESALEVWMATEAPPDLAAAWAALSSAVIPGTGISGAGASGESAPIPTLAQARERRRRRAELWESPGR
ncbi:MAG: HEAT repeat domain-containing protein [Planctomycetota bacterium]|nr:HEAT repeat domain-containing protein [Planctomycetota bacterium]